LKPWFGNTGLEFFSDFGVVIAEVLGGSTATVTFAEGEFLLRFVATSERDCGAHPTSYSKGSGYLGFFSLCLVAGA
jgi:hypothetical protein